jgi:hypothetical protein
VIPTPATGYLLAAAFVLGMGIGGTAAYKIEHGAVLAQKLAIAEANKKAAAVLAAEKEKVAKATHEAEIANINLDKAHEASIVSINAVRDELNALGRLRDPNSSRCKNTLPSSANPKSDSTDGEDGADISAELERLLRSESARADEAAVGKNVLLDFVNNNCGIVR